MIYNAKKDPAYRAPVEQFLREWFDGGSIPRTPKGLAWRDHDGSIRHAGTSRKRTLSRIINEWLESALPPPLPKRL